MRKIVLFFETPDNHQKNLYENFKAAVEDSNIVEYMEAREYFSKSKDHRIYDDVLFYCYANSIDYLFIPFFAYPEYLLASLNAIAYKLKTKIVLGSTLSWWHSVPRANAFKELLKKKQVQSLFLYSLHGELDYKMPEYIKDIVGKKIGKSVFPWYDFLQEKQIDYLNAFRNGVEKYKNKYEQFYNNSKPIFMFFGSMFYGKGIDIFADAVSTVNKGIKFLVVSRKEKLNFDFDYNVFDTLSNVTFISDFVDDEEKLFLFSLPNVVLVLPYRLTYQYGSSAVFAQCMVANNIVIAPNFYPFTEPIKKYKVGKCFGAEDSDSLMNVIELVYNEYNRIKQNANFEGYLNRVQTWYDMVNVVAGGKYEYK